MFRMAGVGRRLGRQHRPLSCNLTAVPNSRLLPFARSVEASSALPGSQETGAALPRHVLPSDLSAEGCAVPGKTFPTLPMPTPNGGRATTGVNPLGLQHSFGNLAGPTRGLSMVTNSGARPLVQQIKQNFCTVATNQGDDDIDELVKFYLGNRRIPERGNAEELHRRVELYIEDMRKTMCGFKSLYYDSIRPLLVSRCLIVPFSINDPKTAFLHTQTFKIAQHNASYISCFDVTAFRASCEDAAEWFRFIDYLVEKRIYVIEDWLKSLSTIEILMYDHGLKEPDDGTDEPFFKGECDATFDPDTQTASMSYIIWKGKEIIHAEVFSSVKCSSSVEAETFAVMSLFFKCKDLNIRKLHVWSDSKTVTSVLTGELPVDMNHQQRESFLMLRAMRTCFKSLVVTWKPRELMVFADFLARAAKLEDVNLYETLKYSLSKFLGHLKGSPVFRIERTKATTTAVKKFGKVMFDESMSMSGHSRYLIELEDDSAKFDCIVGLNQSLEPSTMEVFIGDLGEDKLEKLKKKLATLGTFNEPLPELKFPGGTCCSLIHKSDGFQSKKLVVVHDHSVTKDMYYTPGDFHVLLVTPSEREDMTEKIDELTALGFVYFNGIRFPLNDKRKRREEEK